MSDDHAGLFLARVNDNVSHGRAGLVPLLHSSGLELLFVGASTPLVVHDARDHSLDGSHTAERIT